MPATPASGASGTAKPSHTTACEFPLNGPNGEPPSQAAKDRYYRCLELRDQGSITPGHAQEQIYDPNATTEQTAARIQDLCRLQWTLPNGQLNQAKYDECVAKTADQVSSHGGNPNVAGILGSGGSAGGGYPGVSSADSLVPHLRHEYIPEEDLYGRMARADVYADPEMAAMQKRALGQLEEWGQGKLTQTDLEAMHQTQADNARQERSQREAIMQQAAMRGAGGSGAEMAGILGAQQEGAGRNAADAVAMKVAAQQRALAATEAGLKGAGDVREQGFGEAWDRAAAEDESTVRNTEYNRLIDTGTAEARANAERERWNQQFDLAQAKKKNPALRGASGWETAFGSIAQAGGSIADAIGRGYSRPGARAGDAKEP